MLAVAASVLGFNCASRPAGSTPSSRSSGVTGSRADLRTALGAADGYLVEACSEEGCVGVSGRGTRTFAASSAGDDAGRNDREPLYRLRDGLSRELAGISSIHRSGFAGRCGTGRVFFEMSDWRQTDAAVAAAGAFLRARDLNDAVAICVAPRVTDVNLGGRP